MIYALGYALEQVRTVLKNDTNDIYIYKKREEGINTFYTCVCIKNDEIKKKVLLTLSSYPNIAKNMDYVGQFILQGHLNLLFLYHEERKIASYIEVCGGSFEQSYKICMNLVRECQASHFPTNWLLMLLQQENINVTEGGEVYFNYFLDFDRFLHAAYLKETGFDQLAYTIFEILSRPYWRIHKLSKYPKELRLLNNKMNHQGFNSYADFYEYLKLLPEKLESEQGVIYKLKLIFSKVRRGIKKYAPIVMMGGIICIAVIYSLFQIHTRNELREANKAVEEEMQTYKKMYCIGTVEIQKVDEVEESK